MERYIVNMLEIMNIWNVFFFIRSGVLVLLFNLLGIENVVVKVIVVKRVVVILIVLV